MDLEAIRSAWPAILERARSYLPALGPLLEGVAPVRLDGSRLVVALPAERGVYAGILESSGRLSVVARAIEAETRQRLSVELDRIERPAPRPTPELPEAEEPLQVVERPVAAEEEAGSGRPAKKEKPERDPLAGIRGEQVRYLLEFNPPPGESVEDLIPWWERRAERDELQREYDARKDTEEAVDEPPVDGEWTERIDLPLVSDTDDAIN